MTTRITRKEWSSTPKDYRSYIDGKPYRLRYDPQRGTILEPVEIIADEKAAPEVKNDHQRH